VRTEICSIVWYDIKVLYWTAHFRVFMMQLSVVQLLSNTLSYRVCVCVWGGGGGEGKLEASYCCIRQVCVVHHGDSSLHPSLFFVRPAGFCIWSTSTQIPRIFFAVKIAAHGAPALVAVCRVLAPFSSIVLNMKIIYIYIYYVARLNYGSFKCRDRFYLTAVASHFPGARLESGLSLNSV